MQWVDELVRRNCGTGAGGFQPGNSCGGGGGGSSERDAVPMDDDQFAKKSWLETNDGSKIMLVETDRSSTQYLYAVEDDGAAKGMAVNFDEASGLQVEDGEPDRMVIEAYAANAYPLFTGSPVGSDDAEDTIDAYGAEKYGTIDSEGERMIVNNRIDEYEREFRKVDRVEHFGEEWNSMTDEERKEAESEWLNEKAEEIAEEVARMRTEARESAIREMTRDLETATAKSRLGCCMQLYRGMNLSAERLDRLIREGSVAHDAVNSWTTSRSAAAGFARNGVILVSRNPRAGWINKDDIGGLNEREVIRPPSRMRITKVVKTGNGGTTFLFLDEDPYYGGDR